ncbi:MAG: hypothetical protein J7L92_06445 [Dehalococcoidia bacterium]|nr:hypothetical protein [Dehalococcoidia bacterium]
MERDGYEVDHEILRRWLLVAGLWKRQRKHARHREWRERKAHFGELGQMDGSHHRWFEDRGEEECLTDMVDSATGKSLALLDKEEITVAAMKVLWVWVERYGIPKALYADWKNVYVTQREPTVKDQLAGELPLTQSVGNRGNTYLLRIIPREDSASRLNVSAQYYRCEATRGHF